MNHSNVSRRQVLGGILSSAFVATVARGEQQRTESAGADSVDVHHHLVPPPQIESLSPHGVKFLPVMRDWSPRRSLDAMDAAGIHASMVSITSPGLWFDDERAATLARACNEYAASLGRDHKGRFGFFAALPMPNIDAALEEAEYALDVLGARGIHLFTAYGGKYLGDPLFAPLFEELGRRRAVAFVHPLANACCVNIVPGLPDNAIEFGTETTRTIASLLFSGTAAKRAGMEFIFSHAGGTMPSVIERFEYFARTRKELDISAEWVRETLAKFHYDTAQAANPTNMTALKTIVPVSQFVFGSDYPFREIAEHVITLKDSGLKRGELQQVFSRNFLRLTAARRSS